jgi:hypothetical protein
MSPGEVRGLQALAKSHGGSLTVNPDTGLVEAGFLRNLLPMIAGAALASTGLGAPAAAALIGGGTAVAKGDLKAGLMAGIGAYGGAGLAQGAFTAGATPGGDAVLAEGAGAGGANVPVVDAPAATPVDTINAGGNAAPATQTAVNPNAPTSFSSAPADTLRETQAYSATPTNYGAFGEAPAPVDSGATMSDAAQRQASASYGEQTVAQPTGGPSGTGASRVWENFNAKPSYGIAAIAPAFNTEPKKLPEEEKYDGPLSQYKFDPNKYRAARLDQPNPYYQAQMYNYADGGPIEQMSNQNEVGMNTGYPGADINQGSYATPWQTPVSRNVVTGSADVGVNPMNGEMNFAGGGGISSLGSYSDGGRMLKGPGDGMSDSIPAQIGSKQPARLADGEFVVPADVVSHLGNGSTDAGARQLYSMMDRIRSQRTGKKKQAPKVNPSKAMPV